MNALSVLIALLAFWYSNDQVEALRQTNTTSTTYIETKVQASNSFNWIDGNLLIFRYSNERIGINYSKKIEFNKESTVLKYWINGLPLKVITHGWIGNDKNFEGVFIIRNAYVKTGGYNIITVDWSVYAFRCYFKSAYFTSYVGKRIAEFLDRLIGHTNTAMSDIHLIGHSLGSHVMGSCGDYFKNTKSKLIGRITGLDPAKPGFEKLFFQTEHLDASDAAFVDVIHTAGGTFGYLSSLGHIDFFPNSGLAPQPGCMILLDSVFPSCSHSRAVFLYSYSIFSRKSLAGVRCFSWWDFLTGMCENNEKVFMGHDATPSTRGKYYLRTNGQPPY